MNHSPARPILISVVQYQDSLAAGSLRMVDIVEKVPVMGAGGLEMRPDHWPKLQSEVGEVRERLEARGLLVTYATFSTLFNEDDKGARQLWHDLETAHALGSPQLRVFQGAAPGADDGPVWNAARHALAYAASLGVVIALENLGAAPGATLAEIERVLGLISSPALGTNIDIGNYAKIGQDVPAAIRAIGARAVSSHLKDMPAPPDETPTFLGAGTLPLDAIFDEFAGLPQRLLHCFEFEGGPDPDHRIRQSLAFLRQRGGRI